MDRRDFLALTAGATAASAAGCRTDHEPKWLPAARVRTSESHVAVLRAADYAVALDEIVADGIEICGLRVRGRRILLKPNLVEFDTDGVINTHPNVLHAAISAFRRLGAADVVVGEGAGHRRDDEYLLRETGFGAVLRDTGTRFVDLNLDDVHPLEPRSHYTRLGSLYLPAEVLGSDLLVSMPKLKTHHWAGVTLSLKNMFGILPGAVYGWPKNVLHWAGIGESILDVNATLTRLDRFAIADGIVGMEGNGPIQGTPRHSGVLVFGADPVAVDATCCRLMGVEPAKVEYLREAGRFLGNLPTERIRQRGEDPATLAVDYRLLDQFSRLRQAPGDVTEGVPDVPAGAPEAGS